MRVVDLGDDLAAAYNQTIEDIVIVNALIRDDNGVNTLSLWWTFYQKKTTTYNLDSLASSSLVKIVHTVYYNFQFYLKGLNDFQTLKANWTIIQSAVFDANGLFEDIIDNIKSTVSEVEDILDDLCQSFDDVSY